MSLERVVFATRRLNPQVPPTLAVQLKATRGRGGLQTAWPRPAQGSQLFWPIPAPSHLTPVPGPSGSAAAPLPPLSPGPPAPGAAGIPGVVLGRQRKGGQGLCPRLQLHSSPSLAPLPLGGHAHRPAIWETPTTAPVSSLQTRSREVQYPAPGSHSLLEESWTQNWAWPHTQG